MSINRVFLIVLDSVGIGALPDAAEYGDEGSNTLKSLWESGALNVPNLSKLGLFAICGNEYGSSSYETETKNGYIGSYARLAEKSKGKDTTIGHWEIAGLVSEKPLPTYPNGFPADLLKEFTKLTGRGVLCNKPYSGTQVILDYGRQQKETGELIVYTSADSVFQIAANEDWIPLERLYRYCETAREMLHGEHGVGRVIARPFRGEYPNYERTSNRHDYSIAPPQKTMLDFLTEAGLDTIGIGKINDIFAGRGISFSERTKSNDDGMEKTKQLLSRDFHGLAFVNLVDFDMLYGHRNDVPGYTEALNRFDVWLGDFLPELGENDLLLITADHGCDPATPSTDHSREYVPLLLYGSGIQPGVNLGVRDSFSDISATVLDMLGQPVGTKGKSFKSNIER